MRCLLASCECLCSPPSVSSWRVTLLRVEEVFNAQQCYWVGECCAARRFHVCVLQLYKFATIRAVQRMRRSMLLIHQQGVCVQACGLYPMVGAPNMLAGAVKKRNAMVVKTRKAESVALGSGSILTPSEAEACEFGPMRSSAVFVAYEEVTRGAPLFDFAAVRSGRMIATFCRCPCSWLRAWHAPCLATVRPHACF
jgi:hypothetical protein